MSSTSLSLVAAAFWNPAFIILAIGGVTYLIAYLEWWLYGRLICLSEQDECLIGVAIGKPSVKAAQKGGDNDASFNVALAPSPVDLLAPKDPNSDDKFSTRLPAPKEHYWENAADPTVGNKLQGKIVEPNALVQAAGRGYVSDEGHVRYLKAIHCEFEGSGIKDLLDWAYATLALLLAIAALSAFPGLGLFLTLSGTVAQLDRRRRGAPRRAQPGRSARRAGQHGGHRDDRHRRREGQLGLRFAARRLERDSRHPRLPGDRFDAGREDLAGRDRYAGRLHRQARTGHAGKVERAIGVWCLSLRQAEDAEDGGSRDDPQNNWVLHPLVDGCSRDIIL